VHHINSEIAIPLDDVNIKANLQYPNTSSRGHDRMIVVFTTTCAIGAYHHKSYELEPRS
jgi:hypothetical protein